VKRSKPRFTANLRSKFGAPRRARTANQWIKSLYDGFRACRCLSHKCDFELEISRFVLHPTAMCRLLSAWVVVEVVVGRGEVQVHRNERGLVPWRSRGASRSSSSRRSCSRVNKSHSAGRTAAEPLGGELPDRDSQERRTRTYFSSVGEPAPLERDVQRGWPF